MSYTIILMSFQTTSSINYEYIYHADIFTYIEIIITGICSKYENWKHNK